ncbi:hypothetical protein SE17_34980, partial [Kouleothrix aurantiaca]
MLVFDIGTFSLAWWLGLYLLARNPRKPLLRRAGLGLAAYALALAADTLARAAAPDSAPARWLAPAHTLLIFLPALSCGLARSYNSFPPSGRAAPRS